MNEVTEHIEQIRILCGVYKVKSLFAFGSVLGEEFNQESDIDLVVEIDDQNPLSYTDRYFELKFQLENILRRKVDLLEQQAIKNPYLMAQIEQTKMLIYGH